ncbi:hypothetical protein [Bacteroides sp.]
MEEKKPYKLNEPKNNCVHEPSVGYIPQPKPLPVEESEDEEFERLWREGMTVEECRAETKRIIREIAAKKYGKR